MQVSRQEALNIFDEEEPYKTVRDEIYDTSRWSIHYEFIPS